MLQILVMDENGKLMDDVGSLTNYFAGRIGNFFNYGDFL